jgi:hypothetical protein
LRLRYVGCQGARSNAVSFRKSVGMSLRSLKAKINEYRSSAMPCNRLGMPRAE